MMDDYNIDWNPLDMLEVYLDDPDDFLKVKETLTRIGVSSKTEDRVLFQSCHILHKQGRYFIVHFKEMFMLDGKPGTFTLDDKCRRNTIALLLNDWGLLRLANVGAATDTCDLRNIKIVSFKDKCNWDLRSKYTIGQIKKKE